MPLIGNRRAGRAPVTSRHPREKRSRPRAGDTGRRLRYAWHTIARQRTIRPGDALPSARAELPVDGFENQGAGRPGPVATRFKAARDQFEAADRSPEDADGLENFIQDVLTSAPQLSGMGVIRPDRLMRLWETGIPDAMEKPREALRLVEETLTAARETDDTLRAAPFVSLVLVYVILAPRIRHDMGAGQTGVLVGGTTGARLSEYMPDLSNDTLTAFVLYDRPVLIACSGRAARTEVPQSAAFADNRA